MLMILEQCKEFVTPAKNITLARNRIWTFLHFVTNVFTTCLNGRIGIYLSNHFTYYCRDGFSPSFYHKIKFSNGIEKCFVCMYVCRCTCICELM